MAFLSRTPTWWAKTGANTDKDSGRSCGVHDYKDASLPRRTAWDVGRYVQYLGSIRGTRLLRWVRGSRYLERASTQKFQNKTSTFDLKKTFSTSEKMKLVSIDVKFVLLPWYDCTTTNLASTTYDYPLNIFHLSWWPVTTTEVTMLAFTTVAAAHPPHHILFQPEGQLTTHSRSLLPIFL